MPNIFDRHLREFLDRSSQELLPGSLAPEEFTGGNTTSLIQKRADNFRVQTESERLGTARTGTGWGIGVYRDATAMKESVT